MYFLVNSPPTVPGSLPSNLSEESSLTCRWIFFSLIFSVCEHEVTTKDKTRIKRILVFIFYSSTLFLLKDHHQLVDKRH